MSANHRPKQLYDLAKWDADLLIVCDRCGRRAIFELVAILTHFRSRGWSTAWGNIAYRFVCKGNARDRGCGSKELSAHMAPRVKPPPPAPVKSELQLRQEARRGR